jgi:hypothetical protein
MASVRDPNRMRDLPLALLETLRGLGELSSFTLPREISRSLYSTENLAQRPAPFVVDYTRVILRRSRHRSPRKREGIWGIIKEREKYGELLLKR